MRTLIIALILGLCLVAALGTVLWITAAGGTSAILAPMADAPVLELAATSADDSDASLFEDDELQRHSLEGQVTAYREVPPSIEPFSGVELRLARRSDRAFDAPVARAKTNRRGEFRFAGVAPGSYRVAAFPPAGRHAGHPQIIEELELLRGRPPTPIAFHFGALPGPAIEARVPANGDAVADASPAADAALASALEALQLDIPSTQPAWQPGAPYIAEILGGKGSPEMVVFTSGGEGGAFTGSMTILRDDMVLVTGEAAQPEPVDPDEGRATIRGHVTDTVTGGALSGSTVKLIGRNMDWSTSTDDEGAFIFKNVEPGEYSVSLDGLSSGSIFRPSPANTIIEVFTGQIQDVYLSAERIIVIENLVDGGQAQGAGMQSGDELLTYAGVPVTSQQHLRDLRAAAPKDQEVEIAVRRGSQIVRFVILGGTIGVYTDTRYR